MARKIELIEYESNVDKREDEKGRRVAGDDRHPYIVASWTHDTTSVRSRTMLAFLFNAVGSLEQLRPSISLEPYRTNPRYVSYSWCCLLCCGQNEEAFIAS